MPDPTPPTPSQEAMEQAKELHFILVNEDTGQIHTDNEGFIETSALALDKAFNDGVEAYRKKIAETDYEQAIHHPEILALADTLKRGSREGGA